VESEFDPDLVSPQGAVGLWQLERGTAEQYGLRVEGPDERRSPEASSRAAAHLLADRLAEFGEDSALLALASFNMGEEKTESLLHEVALERGSWHSGLRSFWHLYRMRRLPPEVMAYVPDVVGAAVLDGAGK
jgi:membrane-bound lytic murein transglycosylase MltF